MSQNVPVICYKCRVCESWHPDLTGVKQHMNRRHNIQNIESTEGLDTHLCSQTGPRRTYLPVTAADLAVAPDNFRIQSLFAQRSLFGVTVPSLDVATMLSYFPPRTDSTTMSEIRKDAQTFLKWIEEQCNQEWSCDLRNRMASHGFRPIQSVSHSKYVQAISAFCFFCRQCPWTARPADMSVGNIMWAAFSEFKTRIRTVYMVEKFLFYSYFCMGRGPSSRDLALISSDCACLKYGLRGGFLHYCLKSVANNEVSSLDRATLYFTNPGSFLQLTSLKRIADACKPQHQHQPISWNEDAEFRSLTVLSVGVIVTHSSIRCAFLRVLEFVGAVLDTYGVPNLDFQQFKAMNDSPTSSHAAEGLVVFNPEMFPNRDVWLGSKSNMDAKCKTNFYKDSFACANHLVVGMHLSAGPGFRGTEDASILLVNSMSQAPRNIRAVGKGRHMQLCIIPDYSKQRPLSMQNPSMVAKFLPVSLAFLLIRYIFFMKTLEGLVSGQGKNCATFLVTNCGHPVAAESYNQVLNCVFRSIGLGVDLSDLRHALEAFARHLGQVMNDASISRNRLMANHSERSSAGYGRDDFTVSCIDADLLQMDEVASHHWNTIILNSSNRLFDDECDGPPPAKKRAHAGHTCSSPLPLIHHKSEKLSQIPDLQSPDSNTFVDLPCGQQESLQCLQLITSPQKQSIADSIVQSPSTPACFQRFHSSQALKATDLLSPIAEQQSKLHLQLSQVQKESIQFITSVNEDSVVILPTGSGKTRIVEFFGGFDGGVAIVISPFQKLSVQLETVLGETAFRWPLTGCSETMCFARARFIVVAIEHCEYNSQFLHFLRRLSQSRGISKLFVDEVHHLLEAEKPEFRPCLANFWTFRSKLLSHDVHLPVVGLTATLRQSDISKLRQLLDGISSTMPVFRRSCYRSSIQMELVWAKNFSEAQSVCINDALVLAETGKTIVFGTNLHTIGSLATQLNCQQIVSGTTLDLKRFTELKLVVASSCAGHGLDLRDILSVCILGIPYDAETLIQWAGRIREAGLVKVFLDVQHVSALSKWDDRRGELARVFLKCKQEGQDPHRACCHLIDYVNCDAEKALGQRTHSIEVGKCTEQFVSTQHTQSMQTSATLKLDTIFNLKVRIRSFISSFPMQSCKLCYILGDTNATARSCGTVCNKFAGLCIKCFHRHAYRDCTSKRFVMPGKTLCYRCFLPFTKGVGPDLHPGPIGAQCTSPVREVLPQAVFVLFHTKSVHIPSELHGDFEKFIVWLHSTDKQTGIVGILAVLSKLIP